MKYILIIDTVGEEAKIALAADGRLIDHFSWAADRNLGRMLLENIEAMLNKAGINIQEVGRVAVTSGPGGYSNLRAGIVTANMISLAAGCDMAELKTSSLDVMAREAERAKNVSYIKPHY